MSRTKVTPTAIAAGAARANADADMPTIDTSSPSPSVEAVVVRQNGESKRWTWDYFVTSLKSIFPALNASTNSMTGDFEVLGKITTPAQASVSHNSVITRSNEVLEPHFNRIDLPNTLAWGVNSMVGVTAASPGPAYMVVSHSSTLGSAGVAATGRLFMGNLNASLFTGYDHFDWSKGTVVMDSTLSFAFVSGGYAAGNVFRILLGGTSGFGIVSGLTGTELMNDKELTLATRGMGVSMTFTSATTYDIRITTQNAGSGSPIVAVTNTSPIQITTQQNHGLATGDQIEIRGIRGNVAANGIFTVTVTGATTFTLNGSTGNGAFGIITYGAPANGDTVTVNGNTFTKVASAPGANQYTTQTQLEALIEAIPNVSSVEVGATIQITTTTDSLTVTFGTNTGTMSYSGAASSGVHWSYISDVVASGTSGVTLRIVLVKTASGVSLYFNDTFITTVTKGIPNSLAAAAMCYAGLNRAGSGSCSVFVYRTRIVGY